MKNTALIISRELEKFVTDDQDTNITSNLEMHLALVIGQVVAIPEGPIGTVSPITTWLKDHSRKVKELLCEINELFVFDVERTYELSRTVFNVRFSLAKSECSPAISGLIGQAIDSKDNDGTNFVRAEVSLLNVLRSNIAKELCNEE